MMAFPTGVYTTGGKAPTRGEIAFKYYSDDETSRRHLQDAPHPAASGSRQGAPADKQAASRPTEETHGQQQQQTA